MQDGDDADHPAPSARDLPKATLLLVEDEPAIRGLIARALTLQGYRVLEARHGQEAIEVYNHEGAAVDLVITDVRMPHISGPELVEHLRLRRRTLKVLYITGFPDERTEGERRLVKPFTHRALFQAVRDVLLPASRQ